MNNKYQGRSLITAIIFYFWVFLGRLAQKVEVIVSWKKSKSLGKLALLGQTVILAKGIIHRLMPLREEGVGAPRI